MEVTEDNYLRLKYGSGEAKSGEEKEPGWAKADLKREMGLRVWMCVLFKK